MSSSIYDSGDRVGSISVIVVCKNNQQYLERFFAAMHALELRHDVHFSYIFVENGSVDETPKLIRDFLGERDGIFLSRGNNELIDLVDRPRRLEYLRNISKKHLSGFKSDWVLVVDTEIYFDLNILEALFSKNPTQNGIGMLCAFGIEAQPLEGDLNAWVAHNHYYDTAAFIADDGSVPWPHCMFKGCAKCEGLHLANRLPNSGLVKVTSAFGGLALIRAGLLSSPAVRWKAIAGRVGGHECEHIGLCLSLADESGLSIAVDCDSRVVWNARSYAA